MIASISARAAGASFIGATVLLTSAAVAATVYTETNSASGNEIQIYDSAANGTLVLSAEVPTGGRGSGGGLGSQGALALSADHRTLFAVNAASNDVSAFAITDSGLTLADRVASGGTEPISVTVHDGLLYVVNAGGSGNIAGFAIGLDGRLSPIAGSSRPLSQAAAGPAQIGFDRDGASLLVTEKATSRLVVYPLSAGVPGAPLVHASHGMTPFGFAFSRGELLVSEAFGGRPNASALSSYQFDDGGSELSLLSGSVPTDQTAACWVVVAQHGRYAYVTNTGSGTVTGYRVERNGTLTRLGEGPTAITGGSPTDADVDREGATLYVLSPSIGQIDLFEVNADGSLTPSGTAPGAPASAAGLVVR